MININLWSIKINYFWLPRMPGVTTATSFFKSTRDFLNLLFHMFPYNKIFKVFKINI